MKWPWLAVGVLAALVLPQTLPADTLAARFPVPQGYQRLQMPAGSFGAWLRAFPLKPEGSPVRYYNGGTKASGVHAAVFDFPLLRQDLIQCADAIIKLRAEYLYASSRFGEISFKLTDGTPAPFDRYRRGERLVASGRKVVWQGGYPSGTGRKVFESYLFTLYQYAGTLSLDRDLKARTLDEIRAGDVFIQGGSPGHAILVLDLARSADGRMVMLLGQSYMPSQEFHVLNQPGAASPWYPVEPGPLYTPEWHFPAGCLKGF